MGTDFMPTDDTPTQVPWLECTTCTKFVEERFARICDLVALPRNVHTLAMELLIVEMEPAVYLMGTLTPYKLAVLLSLPSKLAMLAS